MKRTLMISTAVALMLALTVVVAWRRPRRLLRRQHLEHARTEIGWMPIATVSATMPSATEPPAEWTAE